MNFKINKSLTFELEHNTRFRVQANYRFYQKTRQQVNPESKEKILRKNFLNKNIFNFQKKNSKLFLPKI